MEKCHLVVVDRRLLARAAAARAVTRKVVQQVRASRAYAALLHEEADEAVLLAHVAQQRTRLLRRQCWRTIHSPRF